MEIFGQTAALVSDGTGGLLYHLVLLFALGTAAAMAAGRWAETRQPAVARLAMGAGALLVLRLASLVMALVAALVTTLNPLVLVPPFDRAASTLSLLLIIWMVAFPAPSRRAEAAIGLLSVLVVIGLVISWGLWSQQALAHGFYNGSPQETAWELVKIVLLVGGMVLLSVRRPVDWGVGLAVLVLLLAGHLLHIARTIANTSLPGPERLAEIAAVPLLVALIYRRAHRVAPLAPAAPALDLPPLRVLDHERLAPTPADEDTGPLPALEPTAPPGDITLTLVPSVGPPAVQLDARAALALALLGSASGPREYGERLTAAAAHALDAPLSSTRSPTSW
jgi:hypothetical protein